MPRPHTTMRKVRDVLRLTFEEGLSLRQVSASLQIPFTTVADYVRRARGSGFSWPLPDEPDDDALEARLFVSAAPRADRPLPDFEHVHRELRRPGVTLMLLWLEYKEDHPGDGYAYSQFCELYRSWRRHLDVVMRQEHKAGEKLFIDFAGQKIPIYEEDALLIAFEAELFVAVLGASNYLYAEACRSQELIHFVTAHVHAFEFFGAVPKLLIPDNLRSAVKKAHRYEPDVNATYEEMAAHYGAAVLPARAYRPRDKAKAEVGVLIAERWIAAAQKRAAHEPRRGEHRDQRARRVDQRSAVQAPRRIAKEPFRIHRAPGDATAPSDPLRVRHLAQGEGQHRLPHRGPDL